MALTLSGSGITSANIVDGTIVNADVNDVAASKLTGALPAIDGSSLTNLPAANTPAFYAKASSTQTIPSGAWTAINYGSELLDTHNYFASNRFTPQVAGWYWFTFDLYVYDSVSRDTRIAFDTNTGYEWTAASGIQGLTYWQGSLSGMIYMNGSTHYVGTNLYSPSANSFTIQPSHSIRRHQAQANLIGNNNKAGIGTFNTVY